MKVFISHSNKDLDLARKIKELTKSTCDVYIASEDYQPGEPLSNKIEKNIKLSSYFIVLITIDGTGSQWVNQEIGLARACKIPIIPIVEHGVKPPGILQGLEYIEFNRDNPEIAIKSLVEYMDKIRKEKDISDLLTLGLIFSGLILLLGKGK